MGKQIQKKLMRMTRSMVLYMWSYLQQKNLFGYFTVLLGLIIARILQPVFDYQDSYEGSRGTYWKGMLPVHHKSTPWGFTLDDMPDLKGECDERTDDRQLIYLRICSPIHSCAVTRIIFGSLYFPESWNA